MFVSFLAKENVLTLNKREITVPLTMHCMTPSNTSTLQDGRHTCSLLSDCLFSLSSLMALVKACKSDKRDSTKGNDGGQVLQDKMFSLKQSHSTTSP